MSLQVEAAEDIELRAFNVHGHEIDLGIARFGEQGVKGHHFDYLGANIGCRRVNEIFHQTGMAEALGGVKGHFGRSAWRATGGLEHSRTSTRLPQALAEASLWFNQDASPAAHFEKPGLRTFLRFVCADVEKEAILSPAKKLPD